MNVSNLISAFADRHIVVMGEAMLDSYLIGTATRLCQEAPVPVVKLSDRQDTPGGAANVAVNLRSLGAQVSLLSVIGKDEDGDRLQQALVRSGITTAGLLQQPLRRTLVKNRVMAGSQLLVRLDQGCTEAIAPDQEQQIIQRVSELFSQCDAVVLSDYSYGILTPRVMDAIAQLQTATPKLIVVDSKRLERYSSLSVTVVKPNYEEAIRLLTTQTAITLDENTTRIDQIAQHGDRLLALTGAQFVVVTLDADGAVILQRQRLPHHIPAKAMTCVNPTGAGDTFISTLTLALTVGASIATATELAAMASAVVVAKEGTATCSAQELQTSIAELTASASQLQTEGCDGQETFGNGINDAFIREVA